MALDHENQARDQLGSFVSIERQHQHKTLYPNNVSTISDSSWTEEDNRKLRKDIEMIFKEHHNASENASVRSSNTTLKVKRGNTEKRIFQGSIYTYII